MSTKNKAVFGIYVSQLDAENAVHGLKLAGFRATDISILFPDNAGTKDLAMERNTKAPEGTAAGAGWARGGRHPRDGWRGSARWRFQDSGCSSPPAPSWPC